MTDRALRWNLESERWQLVHPGVVVTYSGPVARQTALWAALLHAGDGAVLDGETAASLHGLNGYFDRTIHVRIPHRRHPEKRPGLVIRRTRHLESRSSVERDGYPTLRIERAVVTIAVRRIGVIADSVQQGFTTSERIRSVLLALGPIHGRSRMLRALDDVEGGSRSELERHFFRILRRARLPLPVRHFPLNIDGKRLWLDACYPDKRWFVEIDGKAYHLLAEDWENDLDRQNRVVLEGWRPLRFTARAIRQEWGVVEQVRRALGTVL